MKKVSEPYLAPRAAACWTCPECGETFVVMHMDRSVMNQFAVLIAREKAWAKLLGHRFMEHE